MATHVSGRSTRTVIDTVRDEIANSIDFWSCLGIFDPAPFCELPDIVGQLGCLVRIWPLRPDILLHNKSLKVVTNVIKWNLIGVDLVAKLEIISREVRRGKPCSHFKNDHTECIDIRWLPKRSSHQSLWRHPIATAHNYGYTGFCRCAASGICFHASEAKVT
jgi:hypothetical protein